MRKRKREVVNRQGDKFESLLSDVCHNPFSLLPHSFSLSLRLLPHSFSLSLRLLPHSFSLSLIFDSMVINLSKEHSLVSNWVAELRDVNVQNDRMRFRRNLERIGEVAAFEISRRLPYVEKEIQTPLGSIM